MVTELMDFLAQQDPQVGEAVKAEYARLCRLVEDGAMLKEVEE